MALPPVAHLGGYGQSFAHIPVSPAPPQLQTKLKINQPGDKYEQEADRVADQIMRMPAPQMAGLSQSLGPPTIQRKCKACEDEETLHRDSDASCPSHAPPVVHDILNSTGKPLDLNTRAFFEPRFGHSFEQVRIHDDAVAARSATQISARAYSAGNHIVIGQEHVNDRHLLAHELTHVLQQGGNPQRVSRAVEGPTRRDTCGDTGRWSSWEHMLIQGHYKTVVDHNSTFEYGIPHSSASGDKGYADIISFGGPMVYEIKAIDDDIGEARKQLWRYRLYGAMCPGLEDLRLGTGYPHIQLIPGPNPDTLLVVWQLEPGILVYEKLQRTDPPPLPVPVPVTKPVREPVRVRAPQRDAPALPPGIWIPVLAGGALALACALGGCLIGATAAGVALLVGTDETEDGNRTEI